VAPAVEGSSPFTHPKAPVAQLDRASDFESAGRPFESDRARHELINANCEINNAKLAIFQIANCPLLIDHFAMRLFVKVSR
jgi:hypothetical protein